MMNQLFKKELEITNCNEIEEELSELHNNIHHIERRIRLTDTEKKVDRETSEAEIKKNDLEIKQLIMQVKELEVLTKRSQKADENIVSKELEECSRSLGPFKGKPAKDVLNLLDAEVLELDKKCKAMNHEFQLLKRGFISSEQQLSEMSEKCEEDFMNEPTEYDSLQRIRELENAQQIVNKNILENEIAQNRYKTMKEHLQKNQLSYPILLMEVEKEFKAQEADISTNETIGPKITEPKTISESGDGDNIEKKEETQYFVSEQKRELQEIQEKLSKIKETTTVSDLQDVERRFQIQNSMNEDLFDLKKRLVKALQELRMQKKQLDSRMVLLKNTNSGVPKRELSQEINLAKNRLKEQEQRKIDAKSELEKLSSLLTEIETQQKRILKVLESHFIEEGGSCEKLSKSEITKKIELLLQNNLG